MFILVQDFTMCGPSWHRGYGRVERITPQWWEPAGEAVCLTGDT